MFYQTYLDVLAVGKADEFISIFGGIDNCDPQKILMSQFNKYRDIKDDDYPITTRNFGEWEECRYAKIDFAGMLYKNGHNPFKQLTGDNQWNVISKYKVTFMQ
ncbi:MAG: hypothetical protein JW841_13255 [Deltaproteobacteria bacterium]|nr:hypothetical protein [Deltaproteobacteria bacterium]